MALILMDRYGSYNDIMVVWFLDDASHMETNICCCTNTEVLFLTSTKYGIIIGLKNIKRIC